LLVNIIPNNVMSLGVRTIIFCNSRIASVNFSYAITEHLFNAIDITQ